MHPAVAAAGGAQVTGPRLSQVGKRPGSAGWSERLIRPQRSRVSAPEAVPGRVGES